MNPLPQNLPELAERLRQSSVQVRGHGPGGGSGVVWSRDGVIVTNAHVARGDPAQVELSDGRRLEATIVSRDPRRDLAALRVKAEGLVPVVVGDSDSVRVGQIVAAVGNPLGVVGAVTTGIIHAVDADPNGWIQADVRLAPGNSGGMLANAAGEVIGINTMIYAGLALSVPSRAVEEFLSGQKSRPALGVTLRPVSIPDKRGHRPGLMILEVEKGGAADRAGLLQGDVLVSTYAELAAGLHRDAVRLAFLRGGVWNERVVTLHETRGTRAA